jgi:hypothetical protein
MWLQEKIIVRVWVFYPYIALVYRRFSHDGLGPCYYPRGASLSMYAIDCILLVKIGSRWCTATLYTATFGVGQ